MKLLLVLAAFFVIAASIFADYLWRKWIAEQRSQRTGFDEPPAAPTAGTTDRPTEASHLEDPAHRGRQD